MPPKPLTSETGKTPRGEYARLLQWCCGNREAADFLWLGFALTQQADDFVDRDVPAENIDSGAMLRLLHYALVDIPSNPFYMAHRAWFAPIFSTSFLMWEATETWRQSPVADTRKFAYTWRESCEQLIFMTARLIGGLDHARNVIRDVHQYYHVEHQGSEDYYQWERTDTPYGDSDAPAKGDQL